MMGPSAEGLGGIASMGTDERRSFALVVVGMCGSGKSTVAAHFGGRGWPVVRFGEVTISELEKRRLPATEANERAVREELRARHGMEAYAKLLLPGLLDTLARGPVVVDGLYSWSEYKYLKEKLPREMVVVAVAAPRAVRHARLAARRERPLSRREAEERDVAEIEALEKGGPIAIADYTILNDGSLEELKADLDALVERMAQERVLP